MKGKFPTVCSISMAPSFTSAAPNTMTGYDGKFNSRFWCMRLGGRSNGWRLGGFLEVFLFTAAFFNMNSKFVLSSLRKFSNRNFIPFILFHGVLKCPSNRPFQFLCCWPTLLVFYIDFSRHSVFWLTTSFGSLLWKFSHSNVAKIFSTGIGGNEGHLYWWVWKFERDVKFWATILSNGFQLLWNLNVYAL